MVNFEFQNATRIVFGKDADQGIGKRIKQYSSNIMFVHYGDGLIEKLGIYDKVCNELKQEGITYTELTGITPSPLLSKAQEGIDICREKNIDFLLAIGGGSVMDTAKVIAAGVCYDGDVWDYFDNKAGLVEKALPVGVFVTYPATGSETNTGAVVTKDEGMYKRFIDSNALRPVFAILNPEYTYDLPPYLTACGINDMLGHALERYFSNEKATDLSDRMGEAVMRSIINSGREVMAKPHDYDARAEIMYAGLIANNGYISNGKVCGWESHKIAHELTSLYGIAHGATLSIITPAWMKYVYKVNLNLFVQLAIRVFDVDIRFDDFDAIALEGIRRLEEYTKEIGLPTRFSDVGLDGKDIELMAEKAVSMGNIPGMMELTKEDVMKIYELAL